MANHHHASGPGRRGRLRPGLPKTDQGRPIIRVDPRTPSLAHLAHAIATELTTADSMGRAQHVECSAWRHRGADGREKVSWISMFKGTRAFESSILSGSFPAASLIP